MNSKQKIIFSILIPLVLFLIFLKIAGQIGGHPGLYYVEEPFNFSKTWWIWIFFLIIVGYLESKINK